MQTQTYLDRREKLRQYFDRTATKTWEQLTSDAPVSRIRQTVRAGRDEMRNTLLSWLPEDLTGKRIFDAGCGTGALSIEAAKRGAQVVGVDISPSLIEIAKKRLPSDLKDQVQFLAGDMLATEGERFDGIVAMDSLIHYDADDLVQAVAALQSRMRAGKSQLLFTFAPGTPALVLMRNFGRLFPRGDRSPFIEPVAEAKLRHLLYQHDDTSKLKIERTKRVNASFYKSQAMLLSPISGIGSDTGTVTA